MKKKLYSILLSLAMVVTMIPMMTGVVFAANPGDRFYTDADGSNPSSDPTGKYFEFGVLDPTTDVFVNHIDGVNYGDCIIPSEVSDGTNTYSVTTISYGAFCTIYSLTSVTIPSSVTSLEDDVLSFCSNLESVTVKAETPPTLGADVFDGCSELSAIYVPAASVNAYKTADGWSTYANNIQPMPLTIADILPGDFPTVTEGVPTNAWVNENGFVAFTDNNDGILVLDNGSGDYALFSLDGIVEEDGDNYVYNGESGIKLTFNRENDTVISITAEGIDTPAGANGRYSAKTEPTPIPDPKSDDTNKGVKTGDSNDIIFYGFTTLLALLGAGFVYGLRRKEEK